jgi:hypothetical protein
VSDRDAAAFHARTQAWMDAVRDRDRAVLEATLAAEFRLTSSRTDAWVNRERWIELALTAVELRSFAIEELEASVVDAAAVVWLRASQVARVGPDDWSERFMLTDVWVERDGRWQVLTRHSSQPPTAAFTAPSD